MTINAWLKQIHIRGCDQTDIITGQTPLWCWGLGLVTRHGWTSGPSCLGTLSSQMGEVDCVNTAPWPTSASLYRDTQRVLTDFRPTNWQRWMILKMFFRKCKIKSAKQCYARVFLNCLLRVSEGQFSHKNFKLSNLNFSLSRSFYSEN